MNAVAQLTEYFYGKFIPPETHVGRTHLLDDEPVAPPKVMKANSGGRGAQITAMGIATRNRIKSDMRHMNGLTLSELMANFKLSRTAVHTHLKVLVEEGHVKRQKVNHPNGGYQYQYFAASNN